MGGVVLYGSTGLAEYVLYRTVIAHNTYVVSARPWNELRRERAEHSPLPTLLPCCLYQKLTTTTNPIFVASRLYFPCILAPFLSFKSSASWVPNSFPTEERVCGRKSRTYVSMRFQGFPTRKWHRLNVRNQRKIEVPRTR